MSGVLVGRHKRLSFMKVGETYQRMTKFTQLSTSKSAIEYSRHYVDMSTESTDVVGYSTAIGYSFDRHTDTPVHERLAKISDDELMGTEARVEIVTVDLFDGDSDSGYAARHREYSVVPDADGDGTDALIYSGNFRSVSEIKMGTATSNDGFETITFVED